MKRFAALHALIPARRVPEWPGTVVVAAVVIPLHRRSLDHQAEGAMVRERNPGNHRHCQDGSVQASAGAKKIQGDGVGRLADGMARFEGMREITPARPIDQWYFFTPRYARGPWLL